MRARTTLLAVCLGWLAVASAAAQDVVVPNFLDPRRRIDRPNLSGVPGPIRFLTAPDHPPFNFTGADGEPTGFHVELIRAVCLELRLACTVQARSFDQLLPALRENRGDAVMAGVATTPAVRQEFDIGEIYLRSPARFVVPRASALRALTPQELEGKRVAVVANTAHAAFLETFFPQTQLVRFDASSAARTALRRGEADALFGDAASLAFWINGSESESCCVFRGGPYLESRFFGEGYAVVFRPGTDVLRRAVDHALQRLAERGVFTELYLRWFPVSLYER